MKKSIITFELNIGFWVSYFALIMVILGALYGSQGDVEESRIANTFHIIFLFAVVPSAISFYSFYFLIFPRFLQQQKIVITVIFGLLISLGSALIACALLYVTFGTTCGTQHEPDPINTFIGITLFISFIALINGIIALVIRGFITWFTEIKLKEALKQKSHEMEMALVKSQLDPHFLFNTINNIDILILKDATKASDYLNKLSDIMRFMLFETKTDEILLAKELEYIDKYIGLQKIRTANANYVNFSVVGNAQGKMIAPMVFIAFIENAFKHTTNKKLDNAIDITITIDKQTIKLTCLNKVDPHRKVQQESKGLGNELIQKRLHLIYPDKHTLEITNENNLHTVSLIIQNG